MPEPRDTSSPAPGSRFVSSLALFSVCALTFSVSAFSLTGSQSIAFLGTGRVRLLHVLLALAPTFWVASILVEVNDWRHALTLWSDPWRQRLAVGLALLLAAFLLVGPASVTLLSMQPLTLLMLERLEDVFALRDFRTQLLIRNLLGSAVLMLHIKGMLGMHRQLLRELERHLSLRTPPEAEVLSEDIRRYQQLRSGLERLLGCCAASIGLAILITGATRSLLNEVAPSPQALISTGGIVGFGVYYTWFLALFYLPIRKTLNDVGQALAEALVRQSVAGRVTWAQWHAERQAIHTWLGLQGSALQDLQQGLSMLAPLLASISTLAFGVPG